MDRHDTILLACGTSENRKLLRTILEENYNLLEAVNLQQTLLLLKQNLSCIAAVVLDITEPSYINQKALTEENIAFLTSGVPIIVIVEDDSSEALNRAFAGGAVDVIPLHYDHYAMLQRIENVVQLYLHKQNLETLVAEQAEILRHSNDNMVDVLSSIIEYRSVESGQHILRIRRFTRMLLEELVKSCPEYGLTDTVISIISSAAALHDIGKIAIPDAIFMKPGKLTQEEWEIMKTHSMIGCRILESLGEVGNQEYLKYAHNICHYHHERWDGKGYPEGIAGDNIPICAQVVGLADVYDALTSKRVYKEAYSFDRAVTMILNGECGMFSPKLLECFKQVLDQLKEAACSYADGLSPKTESFDTALPEPKADQSGDSLNVVQTKYLSLLHYINAFVMEIDLDHGHYHLVYNPYPEFADFREATSFAQFKRLILDKLVVPEDKECMQILMEEGLQSFQRDGLRKQTFQFGLRSKGMAGSEIFEVTLMRTSAVSSTITVLCRRLHSQPNGMAVLQPSIEKTVQIPFDSAYICRNDRGFTFTWMANEAHNFAGYPVGEIRDKFNNQLIELVYPKDRSMLRQAFDEQLAVGTKVEVEHRVCCKDGHIVWVLNKSQLVAEEDGQEYLHCILLDISATKRAYDELNTKLERYEIILSQTENALFEWDVRTDRITFSDTWNKIFGYVPFSENIKENIATNSHFHPDDLPLLFDGISALESGSNYEVLEVRIATDKGRYLWCRFRATAIRDQSGALSKIAGIIINIDAEKKQEQVLQERIERDALTRLLNKHAGRKMTEEYLALKRGDIKCAMLIIDLDHFKQINDQYGHLFGDTILTQIAKEIKRLFRTQDVMSRIGGDEFMVVMRGTADRNLVENRCLSLLAAFRNRFHSRDYHISISCSIGIALSPEHGSTYNELFQCADQALYLAKDEGRNTYAFYDARKCGTRKSIYTSVNHRIDSDEQPGLTNNNIVRYAFQRLYSSNDLAASVNDILAIVGQQMNVSRVYVFENSADNSTCSNTYEWCNEGITPEIHHLQNVSYKTDIPGYDKNFDENDIFYCPDVSELPPNEYEILEPQGIKSMLQCAIRDGGVFCGYIGFDECVKQRIWTKDQIELLSYFSEVLSVFLQKKRAEDQIKSSK